ncbi:MAG: DUF1127 domain-containing protein [Devosia sp.]
MAFLLASERHAAAAVTYSPIRGFCRWLAKARAERARRIALANLLEFDAALLEDLGINRQDVVDAMRDPPRTAGQTLTARRALSARNWLSP